MENLIVRRVDELGRIVLPIESRKAMSLNTGDELSIVYNENSIVLKKHKDKCLICESAEKLYTLKPGAYMCEKCIQKLIGEVKESSDFVSADPTI